MQTRWKVMQAKKNTNLEQNKYKCGLFKGSTRHPLYTGLSVMVAGPWSGPRGLWVRDWYPVEQEGTYQKLISSYCRMKRAAHSGQPEIGTSDCQANQDTGPITIGAWKKATQIEVTVKPRKAFRVKIKFKVDYCNTDVTIHFSNPLFQWKVQNSNLSWIWYLNFDWINSCYVHFPICINCVPSKQWKFSTVFNAINFYCTWFALRLAINFTPWLFALQGNCILAMTSAAAFKETFCKKKNKKKTNRSAMIAKDIGLLISR